MKFHLRILAIFLFALSAHAQVNTDSLWSVWDDRSNDDKTRLDAISTMAWRGFLLSDPDSARALSDLQYNLAHETGENAEITRALNVRAVTFIIQAEYDTAIAVYNQIIPIHVKDERWGSLASAYNNLGLLYLYKEDYAKSLESFDRSLLGYEYTTDTIGLVGAYQNMGEVYANLNDHEKALEYLFNCMEYDKIYEDDELVGNIYLAIGKSYMATDSTQEAMRYFLMTIPYYERYGSMVGISEAYNNMGECYEQIGEYGSALEYRFKAKELMEEMSTERELAVTLRGIGSTYKMMGQNANAVSFLEQSLVISEEHNFKDVSKETAYHLSDLYRKSGNYQKAMSMLDLYVSIKDSLDSDENQKAIISQQLSHEFERREEMAAEQHQHELKVREELAAADQEHKNLTITIVSILGGVILLVCIFLYRRFKVTRLQKNIIEDQKSIVEEKNREITDSIAYAKRIQEAILPSREMFKSHLSSSFVLYKPKDIVAGDFYWMQTSGSKTIFAAADCTGHGVPGAMVSVVCNNALNRAVREFGLTDPGKILDKVNELVEESFTSSQRQVKDGMDIALCVIDGSTLAYAGAHNPLWIIRKDSEEIEEVKADKLPIGSFNEHRPYRTHVLEVNPADSIYLFSDGFADQFGGEKGKKFKAKNFKKLLLSICRESMDNQRERLDDAFEKWKGSLEQLDDVCVIGVKV